MDKWQKLLLGGSSVQNLEHWMIGPSLRIKGVVSAWANR